MKCRLHVGQLGDALTAVARALSSKPVKPIMEGILLEASGSFARLTGTDGNLTIRTDVTAMVEENGSTVLPGKLFADLIRRLHGDTVDIETDGSAVKIRCGRSRSNRNPRDPRNKRRNRKQRRNIHKSRLWVDSHLYRR